MLNLASPFPTLAIYHRMVYLVCMWCLHICTDGNISYAHNRSVCVCIFKEKCVLIESTREFTRSLAQVGGGGAGGGRASAEGGEAAYPAEWSAGEALQAAAGA